MNIRTKISTALVKTGVAILKKSNVPASTWFTKVLSEANWEDGTLGAGGASNSYRTNAWVNIAVNKIAKNFTRAPFTITRGEDEEKEIKSGPIWELFTNVNPQMSRSQLWYATVAWRAFRGEAIWTFEADFDGLRPPKEIYVHDPNSFVEVLNREKSKIMMWKYYTGSGLIIPLYPCEIIHLAKWNPINEFRGVNPLIAHDSLLSQDYLADQFNLFLLRNRSTPGGLLSTEDPLTPDQAQEYIELWEKEHQGASRTARVAVLGNNLKYQTIGLTPAEMEFLEMKKWDRTAIMAAYGIPPAVAGYKDETSALSGNDTKEQNVQFWTQAILPEKGELEDKLITEFSNRWARELRFHFDVSEIPELQADQEKLRIQDREDVKAGIKLINKVRAERKEEPVPWGNTWWKEFNRTDVMAPAPEPVKPKKEIGKKPEEKPKKQIESVTPLTMFDRKEEELNIFESEAPPVYPVEVKRVLWWNTEKRTQGLEDNLGKSMDMWLFEQRSEMLTNRAEGRSTDKGYWEQQAQKLTSGIKPIIQRIIEQANESLKELYKVMEMEDCTETDAKEEFLFCCCERITSLSWKIREIIGNTPSMSLESLREVYQIARNKIWVLAKLETGQIFNEVRMRGFQLQGFSKHQWLSNQDESEKSAMDGEVVEIGSPFSNGQILPIDLNGNKVNFSLPKMNRLSTKKAGRGKLSQVYLETQVEMDAFELVITKIVADFWKGNERATLSIVKNAQNVEMMEGYVRSAIWGEELESRIGPSVGKTYTKGRKRSFTKAKFPYSPNPQQPALFLANRGVKVKDHVEGIKHLLLDSFAEHRDVPIQEIADRISQKFGIAQTRAKMIARTEVTAAFNGGMLDGMIETKQKLKQWIHSGDALVRPSHWIDEVVGVKEYFTLADGYKVMCPGDGDAEHTVNCRCTMQAIEIEEEDEG